MKKLFASVIGVLLMSSLVLSAEQKVLRLWVFTDELVKNGAVKRFEEQNPDVKVDVTIVPNEEYLNKLKPVLRANKDAPDVFLGEFGYVKDLVESGFWDDLSKAPYKAETKDLVPYQVDMAKDSKGVLRALSWQTTPGGFFYRKSYAKQYLGTDDPVEVGKALSTVDKFLATARLISQKSNGEVKIIAGIPDYQQYPFSNRKESFLNKKNELTIDPELMKFFDVAKTLRDEKLTAEISQWSPPWFQNMKKDGKVFGYILPTWGLHYVLKTNAPDAAGDYGLTSGPGSYFWGGTWMGVYKNSKNKEIAWKLVKMMTTDKETLKWWANSTGDFVGNQVVVNEIKDKFSEPFLGGQNHYAFFAAEAPKINAAIICKYEMNIRGSFMGAITDYIEGKKSKEEAVKSFKEQVKSNYQDVVVK